MKGDYQYFRWPPPKIIYRQSLPAFGYIKPCICSVAEVTCWKLRNQCNYASFSWSGNLPRNLRPVHSIVCWQICLTSQVCLSRKRRISTEKWQEKLHISNMILSYDMIWICICMLSYAYNLMVQVYMLYVLWIKVNEFKALPHPAVQSHVAPSNELGIRVGFPSYTIEATIWVGPAEFATMYPNKCFSIQVKRNQNYFMVFRGP